MSSPQGWKLQPCDGSLKVWQDASDVHQVLFEHPRVMARLFGLGVPCCLLTVRREGKFLRLFATQLSYSKWLELWAKESSGGQVPISKFIGQCAMPSSSPSTSSSSASLAASSASTLHSGQPSGSSSSSFHSAAPDIAEDLTFLTVDDGAGVPRLRISVLVGNKPGEGIAPDSSLVLAAKPDHGCLLGSDLDFIFSEHHPPPSLPQPIRRKMEVTIASRYDIPGTCLIEPVPPIILPGGGASQPATLGRGGGAIQPATHVPTGLQRIGIVHDHMYINFECKENSLGSALLANEALDVVTMDLSHKEGNARQRGWEGAITVGSTSIAKGDVKHTRASSSLREVTTLARPNVSAGTQFRLWDTCRKGAMTQSLSYKATHIPPIESVSKLEDAGLDTTPREFVTSDFAMPMNIKCKGEFLLIGSGLKKHTFEMGRSLGEFQVKVDKGLAKKFMHRFHHSRLALLQAKQKLEIQFIVNHEFDLSMYKDAHLYWLLVGFAERTMCWMYFKEATNHFVKNCIKNVGEAIMPKRITLVDFDV